MWSEKVICLKVIIGICFWFSVVSFMNVHQGDFLEVQWLEPQAANARAQVQLLVRKLRSYTSTQNQKILNKCSLCL